MDPVTAIGVASAAISFVDFAIGVCETFYEIKSSTDGTTKENADIREAEETCKRMSEHLKEQKSEASRPQLGPSLDRSIEKSIDTSRKLMDLLDDIKKARQAKILGSVKALYLTFRNQGKIKELRSTAEACRVTIAQGLIHATWDAATLNLEASCKGFASLDKQGVAILEALRVGENREKRLFASLDTFRRETKSTLQLLGSKVDSGNMTSDRIEHKLDDLLQRYRPDRKKEFVEDLFFRDFQAREKDLSGPTPGTFDWIFDRGAGEVAESAELQKKPTWPSFPRWLENADSSTQYWLSGKAGSGKSTLMAYMIRKELKGSLTRKHLQAWSGPRSLHVLSFFLYRPKGEVQAGMEHLLRSLLYQLLTQIPEMQEILMSKFVDPEIDSKIPVWPVSTLKAMLTLALDTAEDCAFFVFIDGVDEFQDFQNPNEESTTAFDLVDLLYSLQKPENVKLCVSSRPELAVRERHPSFFEAKLADLNWDDICVFVEGQLGAIAYREHIKKEICTRADGIFMWAVFAVKQMNEENTSGLSYQKLLDRLDEMGKGLQTAIGSMLKGLMKHQRAALAFYLHALGLWRETNMRTPITVALLAASRLKGDDLGVDSYGVFTAFCEQEQLALQACSRGLLEVKSQTNNSRRRNTAENVLVSTNLDSWTGSHSSSEGGIGEHQEDSWKTINNQERLRRVIDYSLSEVSWIHRSAYDFFFAAEESNVSLQIFLESANPSEISRQIVRGMLRLCRFQPIEYSGEAEPLAWERALRNTTLERTSQAISYIGGSTLSEQEAEESFDELLCTTRLELLHTWGFKDPVKASGHIPGNFLSNELLDGCLQMSDEDLCRGMDIQAADEMLRSVAMLETGLMGEMGQSAARKAEHYLRNRLASLHKHHFGRLVLAGIPRSLEFGSASREYQTWAMEAIQSWSDRLHRDHFGRKTLFNTIWRILTYYRSQGFIHSQQSVTPRMSTVHNLPHVIFQWTPLSANESTNWYVNDMLQYLIAGIRYNHVPTCQDICDRIFRAAQPWDVWVVSSVKCEAVGSDSVGETTQCQKHWTRIFTTFGHLCTRHSTYTPEPLHHLSYRLIHFYRNVEGFLEVLFEHQGLLFGRSSADKGDQKPLYEIGRNPQEWQATAIIEDVRESASLGEKQKEILIRYIGTWQLHE